MVEHLTAKGIKCVGVVDPPGPDQQNKFPDKNGQNLAALLDFPHVWQPMYEPVWRRTAFILEPVSDRLGSRRVAGVHSNWRTNLAALIKHIRTVSAESKVTLPWNVFNEPPEQAFDKSVPPWNRIISFAIPELTDSEIAALSQHGGFDPKQRWISIEPLDRDRYSLEDRVCDFTRHWSRFIARIGKWPDSRSD